jgi:hypothetical protein
MPMNEPHPHSDYAKIVAVLTALIGTTTDHADRIELASDLMELTSLASFWDNRIAAGTIRGDAFNLAVLGWTGADTKRRLPLVLRATGHIKD